MCKTAARRNTVYPGVFVNYNTKKATASNSLQFLTEVYQSALPASCFILNDSATETRQKTENRKTFNFSDVHQNLRG